LNFILWLIVGGIVDWLASLVMRTDRQQGLLLNIIVGIVGAFLAGWLLTPLFGVSTINQGNFSIPSLLMSLLGAVILLAVVNLFRREGCAPADGFVYLIIKRAGAALHPCRRVMQNHPPGIQHREDRMDKHHDQHDPT
jgi:uncharacterized membrane protein YeaQ/YmgE (transglycosylase-associated protein family)